MPRFLSTDQTVLISTSYKVMYSTLSRSSQLTEIQEKSLPKLLSGSEKPHHIMLARCPYERFRSFYRDKLDKDLEHRSSAPFQWCQRFILWELGISPFASYERKLRALQSLSFEGMLDLLPRLMWNGHLKPQTALLTVRGEPIPLPDLTLRIEDGTEPIARYIKGLGRQNATPEPGKPLRIEGEALAKFNELYAADFQQFGYITIAPTSVLSADLKDQPQTV